MFKLITTRQYSLEDLRLQEEEINKVENLLLKYQSSLLEGYTCVSDSTYNTCMQYLQMINKDSPLLYNDKEVIYITALDDDTMDILREKLPSEELEQLTFLLLPQGINMRIQYEYGELRKAVTFGRSLGCVDLTDKIVEILGDSNDILSDIPLLEVEGVLTLPYSNLEFAKEYCNVQDTYTGAFTLLNSELGEELFELLHFVCTGINFEGNPYKSRKESLEYADSLGFNVAECLNLDIEGNILNTIDNAVYIYDIEYSEYDYKTEGILLLTGDKDSVVIVKVGKWEVQRPRGIIKEIRWEDKKEKKIPILVLEEGVQVEESKIVKEIPLKSINMLLILGVEIGGTIIFEYIGDLGIIPLTKSKELVLL